ncbi:MULTISPECIES: DUF961 family protein [Staphylococcus]|nr:MULTISPECIES: DUF961 family protein [Staphylococcus]ACY11598.1 conserved hypothetical protein, transposon-related protein [Staphylococcus aureus subsp. aureus ED98]ALS71479.1 hypothetical protein AUC49_02090 [Staphylococcus aureus]AXG27413.1 hypothetical protein BJL64_08725 [Staphylococcus aureus]AXG30398.1 hypothetical protein BJL65_09890 [Staphylococcus aureus]EGQ1479322.1 DUF961 domain-containing protein [Staphylococcus aureus]
MAWNPKFDLKETFGDLYFMGVDEKFKYEDGEKTNEKVYAYKLASTGQGEQLTVKVPKEVKIEQMSLCELVGVEAKQYVQSSGDFNSIQPSIKADDIKQIGTISVKKGAPQG